MSSYAQHLSGRTTPQTEPLPGRKMVENHAGGYTFEITPEQRLIRFLTTGSEGADVALSLPNYTARGGATYYQSERALTIENAENIQKMVFEDGVGVVTTILDVVTAKPVRVPKMDPAIFALAICFVHGDLAARNAVYEVLSDVCRIPTHLFSFFSSVKELGGGLGGRGLKRAINNWYMDKSDSNLAYHLVKYQRRNGWSHRDIFRLTHVVPENDIQKALIRWSATDELPTGNSDPEAYIRKAMNLLQGKLTKREALAAIREFKFTHEVIPTELQKDPEVWLALLEHMPMTALIRNLGRMTANGLITPLSVAENLVGETLSPSNLIAARIHPMNLLVAHRQYRAGRGLRGSLSWNPSGLVLDALEDGVYNAFGNVTPTNKRFFIGLDVSSSMGNGSVMGIPGFTPYEAEAALALLPIKTEPRTITYGFSHKFDYIPIRANDTIEGALGKIRTHAPNMGMTDCSLPMIHAAKQGNEVDVFIIYTDNETYYGKVHPSQALREYREKTGINAKLIVNTLTSTCNTIADPNDPGMVDISGFDTTQPQIIQEFCSW